MISVQTKERPEGPPWSKANRETWMMRGRKVPILATAVMVCLAAVWCTVFVYGADTIPKSAKYVGSKSCRSCHTKQYKTWRKTKHYKTFSHLKDSEAKDPECLKCHSTGYGKPGGFVSKEETPKLASTGCEACHGPGSAHAEAAKDAPDDGKWEDPNYPKVAPGSCVACHNPHVAHKMVRKGDKGK